MALLCLQLFNHMISLIDQLINLLIKRNLLEYNVTFIMTEFNQIDKENLHSTFGLINLFCFINTLVLIVLTLPTWFALIAFPALIIVIILFDLYIKLSSSYKRKKPQRNSVRTYCVPPSQILKLLDLITYMKLILFSSLLQNVITFSYIYI